MLDAPLVTKIYRGFLLAPNVYPDETTVRSVEFQFRQSADDSVYSDWADLGSATKFTHYQFIHDSLYSDVFYQYRIRLDYTNNTYTDWSDYAIPGNGQLLTGTETNISSLDQLAASLGTITAGFLRGVVFETSANYPKVRMDPTGFYALSTTATPVFIDASTGQATFTGLVTGSTILGGVFETATPGSARIQLDSNALIQFDGSGYQRFLLNSTGLTFKNSSNLKVGSLDFGGSLNWLNAASASSWGRMEWFDSTGTNTRGRLFGYTASSRNWVTQQAHISDQSESQAEILATSGTAVSGNNYAQLAAQAVSTTYTTFTRAGNYIYTLLDSTGLSNYFLNGTSTVGWGIWTTFSLSYNITGPLAVAGTVTFGSNLPAAYYLLGIPIGTGSGVISWGQNSATANTVTLQVYNPTGFNLTGAIFGIVFGAPVR